MGTSYGVHCSDNIAVGHRVIVSKAVAVLLYVCSSCHPTAASVECPCRSYVHGYALLLYGDPPEGMGIHGDACSPELASPKYRPYEDTSIGPHCCYVKLSGRSYVSTHSSVVHGSMDLDGERRPLLEGS